MLQGRRLKTLCQPQLAAFAHCCEGDRSVIGRTVLITFFEDGRNHGFLPLCGPWEQHLSQRNAERTLLVVWIGILPIPLAPSLKFYPVLMLSGA